MGTAALAITAVAALTLTGCAPSTPGSGGVSTPTPTSIATQKDINAALQKTTTLTFWAWGPQYADVVAAFEKAYPNITVNLENNGSNAAEYTKLQNVITAKSGIPDVAQIEYTALPQFAFGKSLVDLAPYGLESMKKKYSTDTWTQVHVNGGLYGLPQDGGPLALFYRQDLFTQYGLTVPKTWDQFVADAEKLKAADPTKFMIPDAGDAASANALIWQAGGKPYQSKGTDVTVNLADKGVQKYSKTWQKLVDDDLIDTSAPAFSPEWTQGLANGKYAAWIAGAWGSGTLQRRVPQASGDWRVAPVPQYATGGKASGAQGGSSSAILDASPNKLAAIGFVQWMSSNADANKIWVDEGGFPSTTSVFNSSSWLDATPAYFGGEQVNKVFAQSASNVLPGWQFLPYEAYADSVFSDSVGQAFQKKTTFAAGLKNWQSVIVSYGNQQGFTVKATK